MKLIREHINEKFTENSDPIHDMNIGIKGLIKEWLKTYNIKDYKINDDMTIDSFNSINLQNKKLNNFPDYINFNIIHDGFFDIRENNFTSLRGSPKQLNYGYFCCSNNKLRSLKYAPIYVNGDFDCEDNKLTSVEYAPKICKNHFRCSGNEKKFSKKEILSVCRTDVKKICN